MNTITNLNIFKEKIKEIKKNGRSIGFVPTMGFLHEGHLSLIDRARENNDVVIVSIFVNPTQFGPSEDLESYPRDIKRDSALCIKHKVDILFIPLIEQVYNKDFSTFVEVEGISSLLCGKTRPGHFRGVATIVLKLFNMVKPDRAYFGLKDYQQYIIIKKMVKDLDLDIEIIGCPIVREQNGLAMSSRNNYLSDEQKNQASIIYQALREAKKNIKRGEISSKKIIDSIRAQLENIKDSKIDYIKICDPENLYEVEEIVSEVIILVACFVGNARLIDNIKVKK